MKRIFKYELNLADRQEVEVPRGGIMLSVVNQSDCVMVYALVDDSVKEKERREFCIFGTGHPVDIELDKYAYLGTVVTVGGKLVWHVFVKK